MLREKTDGSENLPTCSAVTEIVGKFSIVSLSAGGGP